MCKQSTSDCSASAHREQIGGSYEELRARVKGLLSASRERFLRSGDRAPFVAKIDMISPPCLQHDMSGIQ